MSTGLSPIPTLADDVCSETPTENLFVVASSNVPLATGFKPAVKVLSRKPTPRMVVKRDPVTGLERLTLDDDEDEDDSTKHQPTPEEIRMRQQRELEEKQRRYEEVRAKIFGDSNASSGQSTPRNETTPPSSDGRQAYRKQARGRGGGPRSEGSRSDSRHDGRQDGQSRRTPVGNPIGSRELYDPSYSPKPGFGIQKRDGESATPRPGRATTPREEEQAIRSPIGPDNSGRGGFRFARRGAKEG